MKTTKKTRLEKAGWKVGSTQELLGLTDEEMAIVKMRYSLAKSLQESRIKLKLSQAEFAKQIGSSQSRVAKMEAADASVSLDLLIRSLLSIGGTTKSIGRAIALSQA